MFNFSKVEPKEGFNFVCFSDLPVGQTFVCKQAYLEHGLDGTYVYYFMKIDSSYAIELNTKSVGENFKPLFDGKAEVLVIEIIVSEVSIK